MDFLVILHDAAKIIFTAFVTAYANKQINKQRNKRKRTAPNACKLKGSSKRKKR